MDFAEIMGISLPYSWTPGAPALNTSVLKACCHNLEILVKQKHFPTDLLSWRLGCQVTQCWQVSQSRALKFMPHLYSFVEIPLPHSGGHGDIHKLNHHHQH